MKRLICAFLALVFCFPLLFSCSEQQLTSLTLELESCASFTVKSEETGIGYSFTRAGAPGEFETVLYNFSGATFTLSVKERGVPVKYTVRFLDAAGNELYSLKVLSESVVVWEGYEYASTDKIGLSYLNSLFDR